MSQCDYTHVCGSHAQVDTVDVTQGTSMPLISHREIPLDKYSCPGSGSLDDVVISDIALCNFVFYMQVFLHNLRHVK